MASFCRQALTMSSRSIASKSRSSLQKSLDETRISALLCSTSRSTPRPSRVVSVLGSVESLMPLHSAIASARLKSNIAVDTRCWSWLSQVVSCDAYTHLFNGSYRNGSTIVTERYLVYTRRSNA